MKRKVLSMIMLVFFCNLPNLGISQNSNTKSDPNVPIFEIKNDAGLTVFAVYPGGVKIFIDDQLKATGSGFTVGRLGTGKASQSDYFTVNPGDVKVIIPEKSLKATGGGFTVGRLGTGKAAGDPMNFLTVTPDSTRVYISETGTGGFAIGKMGQTTGVANFLNLTPENYFIGHGSGIKNISGLKNSFLGYQSGAGNIIGNENIFIGYRSGYSNTYGSSNIFIGPYAGYLNSLQAETNVADADNNVFIGDLAGYNNILGFRNVLIGSESGYFNNTNYNVFIGYRSGHSNVKGIQQVFIGNEAGKDATGLMNTFVGANSGANVTSGSNNCFLGAVCGSLSISATNNTFLGNQAGYRATVGDTVQSRNTFVGSMAGFSSDGSIGSGNTLLGYMAGARNGNDLGGGNVFIGYYTGYNVSGDNQLFINNGSGIPLIFGDFSNNRVVINGISTDNPSNYTLYVNGTAGGDASWNSLSDARLKTGIITIPNALDKVMSLRGVNFYWKDKEKRTDKLQIGFLAQEVEAILPEVVTNTNDNYSMQYAPITALLVEAIKEQQNNIGQLKEKIQNLEQGNQFLINELGEIEKLKADISEMKLLIKNLSEKITIDEQKSGK